MGVKINGYIMWSVMVLLVLSSISVINTAESICPPSDPVVYILLAQTKRTIQHEDSNGTNVTITGEVYCYYEEINESSNIEVELFANSTYFSFSSIPILAFNSQRVYQPFNLSIHAPYDTPINDHRVFLYGRFLNDTHREIFGQIDPPSCLVVVEQDHSFRINDIETPSIRAGNSRTCKINLTNTGNGQDRYDIRIPDVKNLNDAGWELLIHSHKPKIPSNKYHIGLIDIKVPYDEIPGEYEIDFIIESRIAESKGESYEITNGTIHIKVLNNYKDEIITGLWVLSPIIIIILITVAIILMKRRKK